MLNQSEPNVILTAHATKVNRPEPNWTEPQTCLAGRNHALKTKIIDIEKQIVVYRLQNETVHHLHQYSGHGPVMQPYAWFPALRFRSSV